MANKKEIVTDEVEVNVEAEDVKPVAKKAARKYAPEDMITCRSLTYGELLMTGKKTKVLYSWANYGDVTDVEYQDLLALKSTRSSYLLKPSKLPSSLAT